MFESVDTYARQLDWYTISSPFEPAKNVNPEKSQFYYMKVGCYGVYKKRTYASMMNRRPDTN